MTAVHHSQDSTPEPLFAPVSVDETTISETIRADYLATIHVAHQIGQWFATYLAVTVRECSSHLRKSLA